jgi:hypothetical protein
VNREDAKDARIEPDEDAGLVSRRRLLTATGTVALTTAVGSVLGASDASATPKTSLPAGWLQDTKVNLTLKETAQGKLAEKGSVGDTALDVTLDTNGPNYTYTGNYGSKKIDVTVKFGTTDPDAFTASGAVGSSDISMTCPAEATGSTKFPITGSIGGQKLKALWDEAAGTLSGTLGTASFNFTAEQKSSKILIAGSASEGKTTGKTSLTFTRNSVTGTISGPGVGLLCGLGEFPALEAGD